MFYILILTNIVFVLFSIYLYNEKKSLKTLYDETVTIKHLNKIDGVFEIHITVDPENNYVKLMKYVNKMNKTTNMKIVFAVSNVKNNQLMISHFTRKDDEKEVIQIAKHFENQMTTYGLKVVRVKIECHNTIKMPLTKIDYDNIYKYLSNKYENCCGKPYFEFHIKIGNNINNEQYLETLEDDIKSYSNVAISYNIYSNNCKPLLTIRIYDNGYQYAQKYKDKILNDMKSKGYVFDDKIQSEFSIYDTNESLDNGWLK